MMRTILTKRRSIAVSIFAAVALAFASGAGAATRILALGDFGVGGAMQRQMGAAIRQYERRHPARLLLTLGDNDYTLSAAQFRSNMAMSFGWLRGAGVGVAGTLGNHDVALGGGRYQFALLGMPARYYRRTLGNADVLVLDSNLVDAQQTAWLRSELAASRARWKIVSFHHPAYTCGAYRGDPRVAGLLPLLERYGVRLVLSGHDHNYQRFAARRGVTYVVHGGGGARLYPLAQCPAGYPRRIRARSAHGFLALTAGPRALELRALTQQGRTIDRVILR